MWLRTAWLALRLYRNPFRAAAALKRLHASVAQFLPSMARKAATAGGRVFVSLYLPGWPSKAFDRCIERELHRTLPVTGRPAGLRAVIVAITRRCALRCEHCVEWDALNQPEGMTAEELQTITRQLRHRGVAQVFLSGGEPLQRFDVLLDLVASMADESDVWVLSSGRGLTTDRARRLREAGLTGVALSLDHWDAEMHDRFRGRPGSFEAVKRAAAQVCDAGLLLTLSLCPVKGFVLADNLDRYAALARSLGASFIQILEPKAVGHYAGQDVELEPAQQQVLAEFTARLNLDPAAHDLPGVGFLDGLARGGGCRGGGNQYAYLDTGGSLHACPFCRDNPVPLLGKDIDQAFADLEARGCPAHHQHQCARGVSS
jgi:MoaA/NifB/PqqE/SkfB family radical SAM enzyme